MLGQYYRFQITSVMSLMHRITGIILSFGAFVLAWWLLAAAATQKPTTREWFSTAKNYALYSNQGGTYDDILKFFPEAERVVVVTAMPRRRPERTCWITEGMVANMKCTCSPERRSFSATAPLYGTSSRMPREVSSWNTPFTVPRPSIS